MGRRETLPVIPDEHLDAIREAEKRVPDFDWQSQLLTLRQEGAYDKGRYDLPDPIDVGPVRGSLYLFVRVVRAYRRNFTAGLALLDDEFNGPYRLIRCNGFHPEPHYNYLEDDVIPPETQHIHFTTERYTKARERGHDGFAVMTDEYDDLGSAIRHLADRIKLVPEGRMLL